MRSFGWVRSAAPVLALVGLVTIVEAVLAWTTVGTPDIVIWRSFAITVDQVGPVHIYSLGTTQAGLMVYNHPPLIGWWLTVVNAAMRAGIPFAFMIRFPSILAHGATALLVWELLRTRVSRRLALAAGAAVAVSPVLVIIAGFHGNNDPVVAALTIASVWLLVDRRAPVAAGVAFALAVSVKIVPLVVLPVLLVTALGLGRQPGRPALAARRGYLPRFVLGAVPVGLLIWLPATILAGRGLIAHVLGYNGSGFPRQWGLYELAHLLHLPGRVLALYTGPGTYLVLAVAALLPAWLIRHQPERAPAAVGLSLTLFVLLSPGWAPQYTSWVAAVVFLVGVRVALVFTGVAGAAYVVLYSQWSSWHRWDFAEVTTLTHGQVVLAGLVWLALVPVAVVGLRQWLVGRQLSSVPTAAEHGGHAA